MPSEPAVRAARRGWAPASASLYGLFGLAVACSLLLASLPRAITPSELPGLVLPEREVEKVIANDTTRASAAPETAAGAELMRLFLEFGQSEIAALENASLAELRRRALRRAYDRVIAADGAEAALALRARALARFEDALALRLTAAQLPAVLGVFPNVLAQHRATYDGEEIAPHFVLRTLYKARWNIMVGLPVDFEFARVEKLAYFGWMGLSADNLPLSVRRQALQSYAAAGGANAAEAQGVLAFLDKDFATAIDQLERAHAERPSLRLRNYLQGAHVASGMQGQQDVAGLPPSP